MAASMQDIRGWFLHGRSTTNKYMLVAVDTFDYEDYPVYCQDAEEAYIAITQQERVMEVYDLEADITPQLAARRNWALPGFEDRHQP